MIETIIHHWIFPPGTEQAAYLSQRDVFDEIVRRYLGKPIRAREYSTAKGRGRISEQYYDREKKLTVFLEKSYPLGQLNARREGGGEKELVPGEETAAPPPFYGSTVISVSFEQDKQLVKTLLGELQQAAESARVRLTQTNEDQTSGR